MEMKRMLILKDALVKRLRIILLHEYDYTRLKIDVLIVKTIFFIEFKIGSDVGQRL